MARTHYLTKPVDQTTMPAGIPYIVGNEAAERFSFYGMKAVLAMFMTKHLVTADGAPDTMSVEEMSSWMATFNATVYFLPFLGAIIADWLLGKYRMILSLSIVYCLGHVVLALMDVHTGLDQRTLLFWGLCLIALGSGGIKPCVTAHVGDQFSHSNEHLLQKVYGWFYVSINFGAMFSMMLTPWLRDHYGMSWAFGVPAILMAAATFVFWLGRNKFVHIPPAGSLFFKETISKEGIRAILNMIPFLILIAPFWSLFDQTSSRWVDQAQHLNRDINGWLIKPDQMQAINPVFVMILVPLFSYVIYPFVDRHIIRVTPLRKVGVGLFLTIPAFAVPAWLETQILAGETPHIGWQAFAYALITLAEVMVSVTGYEFAYRCAPNQMKSLVMGIYLLSISLGNVFTAIVNSMISASVKAGNPILQGADYYWFFTGAIAVSAILFTIWAPFYRGTTYLQTDNPLAGGDDSLTSKI